MLVLYLGCLYQESSQRNLDGMFVSTFTVRQLCVYNMMIISVEAEGSWISISILFGSIIWWNILNDYFNVIITAHKYFWILLIWMYYWSCDSVFSFSFTKLQNLIGLIKNKSSLQLTKCFNRIVLQVRLE